MLKPFIPEPKIFILPEERTPDEYRADIAARVGERAETRLVGEKTSYYFESAVVVPRITQTLLTVRMVFILREPVARAYSNYLWSRQNGLETLSFEEACNAEATRPDPMPREKAYVRPYDYLSRGRYGTHAQRWLRAVDRKRVLFLLYEDLEAAPERLFERLHEFLGVRPLPLGESLVGRINASEPSTAPPPQEFQQRLRHHFTDEVALFAELTGEDVSLWGY